MGFGVQAQIDRPRSAVSGMQMNNDLIIRQLRRPGLQPLDLHVPANSTLCLHGASGSGKTLLLRAIADLDPNEGEASLGPWQRSQVPAHQWRQKVGYLPPESHWWADTPRPHLAHWDAQLLQALELPEDSLDWQLTRLSSGEKQRLALARLLSSRPACLLLDEPTANLDPDNIQRVEALVHHYRSDNQCPVLWVSHDPAQRQRIADQHHTMHAGKLQ